jgi:hypothetical protein
MITISFNFMGMVVLVSVLAVANPETHEIVPGILISSLGEIETSTLILMEEEQ